MSYDVLHLLLDGKKVKAKICQFHDPLIATCDFENGRKANITNINNITYVYNFEDGEKMTFRNSGLCREQIG